METLNLSGLPFASRLNSANDEFVHNHSYYELFYISEGSILHEINGTRTGLSIGDAVLIAPGCAHTFRRISGKSCTHRDTMISPDLFAACCAFIYPDLPKTLDRNRYIAFKIPKASMELHEKNMLAYIMSDDISRRMKFEKFLVVSLLGYTIISPDAGDLASNDFRAMCISVIGELFSHHNAVQLIYSALRFNKSYLSKKFKDTFGVTLTDYVNDLKIKHAAYLLSVTEYTIPTVCDMVGIDSVPYFHKLYKEYFGTTPRKSKEQKK